MSWVQGSQAHTSLSPPPVGLTTWYLSSGDGTRPAVLPAHSPAGTCSERDGQGQEEVKNQSPLTSSATLCASASQAHTPHLCVLPMPPSSLGQAVPGLTAPWGAGAVGTDHVVGAIPETPLDTVCLVQLVDLGR